MKKTTLFYLIVAGLVIVPAAPAFAEDVVVEPAPAPVEQAPAETTPVEPAPEPEPAPAPKPSNDEEGAWSVVDSNGKVVNAIVCTQSVCGEGGALSAPNLLCDGCTVHFQQPGHSGYSTGGDVQVTYDRNTGQHTISESGRDDTGHLSSSVGVEQNGIRLSQTESDTFEDGDVSAKVNVYSVRQLSDQGVDDLATQSVDVDFSTGESLSYSDENELVSNVESDMTASTAEGDIRQSIMNVVHEIVQFFSDLIGVE